MLTRLVASGSLCVSIVVPLGRTALHWAVLSGQLPSVRVLLKHGASLDSVDAEVHVYHTYLTPNSARKGPDIVVHNYCVYVLGIML